MFTKKDIGEACIYSDKYRASTKELSTFKAIQKTKTAYLEAHTHTSQKKNPLKVLFQMAHVRNLLC